MIGFLAVNYIVNERQLILAKATLNSIKTNHDLLKMAVVVNSTEDELAKQRFDIISYGKNNLSANWNKGIKQLLKVGCQYVIVSNLDISLYDSVDNLISFANKKSDGVLWSGNCTNSPNQKYFSEEIKPEETWDHFSFFMVNGKLFDIVGEFDENLKPAYWEDMDMIWRIHLLNEKAYCSQDCKFFHNGQATSKDEHGVLRPNHDINNASEYFQKKWNGVREGKGYLFPFNNPNIPIKWKKTKH